MRVVLDRDEGRHVERAAQVTVAGAADPGGLMQRGAGDLVRRVEPAMGYPLSHRHLGRERGQLPQQLQRADLGDARYTGEQAEAL